MDVDILSGFSLAVSCIDALFVHSVRAVTDVEQFQYELTSQEDPSKWRTLSDILPKREYFDITDEIPDENETEVPCLPPAPDDSTVIVPKHRAHKKVTFKTGNYVAKPVGERLLQHDDDEVVNDYGPSTATSSASSSTRPLSSTTLPPERVLQPAPKKPHVEPDGDEIQ